LLASQHQKTGKPATIINVLINMKNNGKADTTIKFVDKALTYISQHANLDNPEEVKQLIANKPVTIGTKKYYCIAYNRYCQYYGIQWQQPKYQAKAKNRRIPTTKQLEMLIARASPRLSLKLRLSKETGLRSIELCNLKVKDIDTDQRLIYPTTAKNGSARTLKISNDLNMALQNHININKLNQNDKLFNTTTGNYAHSYLRMRNNLAEKLNDQSLRNIRLYDFRHYFATRLYHKTRDILYVKQQMGHKSIDTTLIYVQLLNLTEDDEWTCKTATNIKEATQLIENGFEYITEIDGIKLFRKRK
jgi:integrase